MLRKKRSIIIIIILALLIAVSVFLWKTNIISTLMYSQKYSSDELTDMLTQSGEDLNDEIRSYFDGTLREYTEEEAQQLANGEITSEELLTKIIAETYGNDIASTSDDTPSSTTAPASVANNNSSVNADVIAAKYVSKLYSLEGEFVGKLDNLLATAKSEYLSLPKSERTASKKLSLISKYMSKGYALENSCDSQVSSLLSSLEGELKAAGADTSIVSTIRSQYNAKKNVKRAYYLNKVKK